MAPGHLLTMIRIPLSKLLQELALALGYNTAVGLFLTAVTPYDLLTNLLYTQCVGLSIYAAARGSCLLLGRPWHGPIGAAIGIPLGGLVGFVLATWTKGLSPAEVVQAHPDVVSITAATALIFGVLALWHFHDEARMLEARAEAEAERLRRIEQEALAARTQLALLQAQIEPHFLFNTLSNVVGLVDTNAPAARQMLLDLTALLRTSLARTRRPIVTLGEELDLLRAYLGIMAVRMGARLSWQIDAPAELLGARLPPLLVQPLVENAIRHGMEPKAGNGHLTIRCRHDGGMLDIEVRDDGPGFKADIAEGTGLANVRQRLAAACGPEASLSLKSNPGGGVIARLHLPYRDHEAAPADR
jgi:signal transduction histidine kinase